MARTKLKMDEAKAREITQSHNLEKYTHDELRQANTWVQDYSLAKLQLRLTEQGASKEVRNFISLIARASYGSVETDRFLIELKCYPDWL